MPSQHVNSEHKIQTDRIEDHKQIKVPIGIGYISVKTYSDHGNG